MPKKLTELYFSHDYNARNSTKLKMIIKELGMRGIGIFWCLTEKLYESGGELSNKDVEILAWDLREDWDTVQKVINLAFRVEDEKVISDGVKERIKQREEAFNLKTERARKSAEARWGKKREAEIPEWMKKDNEKKEKEEKKTKEKEPLLTDEERQRLKEQVFGKDDKNDR